MQDIRVELGLPNATYQFSPLILNSEVVAKYSRPNQIRVCQDKRAECPNGPRLANPFRAVLIEGDFAFVRHRGGTTGWVALPNLSEAQGEVVDFTAALILLSPRRFRAGGNVFCPACGYFEGRKPRSPRRCRSSRHIAVEAAAGYRSVARGPGQQPLISRYSVQATVMADIMAAAALRSGEPRQPYVAEGRRLVGSYRDLFASDDPWLMGVDRALERLN